MQISKSQSLRSYFIFGQSMSSMHPFEDLRGTLFAHQALGQFEIRSRDRVISFEF